MNKSNLPQKIIITVLTVLTCCGIYACGAYVGNLGFSFGMTADILLVVICIYYSLSVCTIIRKKPFKPLKISVRKLFGLCFAQAVIIYLLLAASIFFIGTSIRSAETVHTIFLTFCIYSLCRMTYASSIRLEPSSDATELERDLYPELYSVAERAVAAIGFKADGLQINTTGGAGVSAIEIDGCLRLLISTQLPSLVNEYELEALLTAELGLIRAGSVTCDSNVKKRFTHWQLAVTEGPTQVPNFLLAIQYRMLENRLASELEAAAVIDESVRTEAVVCYGIPSDYVNAIAKLTLFGLYLKTPQQIRYFDESEPPRDIEEQVASDYRRFRDENAVRLDAVIKNTTSAGFAISLAERMKQLSEDGVYDLFTEPISRAYSCEAEELLAIGSGDFADSFADSYTAQKERVYLPAIELINSFEKSRTDGCEPELYTMLKAAEAYTAVGSPDKAEAVYDSILANDPSLGRVCLEKGLLMLGRFDEAGIPYLDRAIKDNRFCAGRVFVALSEYYATIGNNGLSSIYRAKAEEFDNSDSSAKNRIFNISSTADLSPLTLDRDTVNEVSDKLKEIVGDSAERIVIAARELDSITYSVVFVKLKPDLSHDQQISVLHTLYIYLDSRNEEFYLTEYSELPSVYKIVESSEFSVIIDLD